MAHCRVQGCAQRGSSNWVRGLVTKDLASVRKLDSSGFKAYWLKGFLAVACWVARLSCQLLA